MNPPHSVDQLIKPALQKDLEGIKERLRPDREELISFDASGKRHLPKKGLFRKKANPLSLKHIFLIVNKWSAWVEIPLSFDNPIRKQHLSMKVQYRVLCEAERVEEIGRAFLRQKASQRVESIIIETGEDFLEKNKSLLARQFEGKAEELNRKIVATLSAKFGLKAEAQIMVPGIDINKVLYLEEEKVQLRFKDFDFDMLVDLTCEVKINPIQKVLAAASKIDKAQLLNELIVGIKSFYRLQSLKEFLTHLSTSSSNLLNRLNQKLEEYGRKIDCIHIKLHGSLDILLTKGFPQRTISVVMRGLSGKEWIKTDITYYAKVEVSQADRAIKILGNRTPIQKLESLINEKVQFYFSRQLDNLKSVILNFAQEKLHLANFLAKEIDKETGLHLETYIVLKEDPEVFETTQVNKEPVYIQCLDTHREFRVEISTQIELIPEKRLVANAFRMSHLDRKSFLLKKIQEYCKERVSLHMLYEDLNETIPELQIRMDKELLEKGYHLTPILLQTIDEVHYKSSSEGHVHPVKLMVKGGAREVIIENHVLLRLEDLGKFVPLQIRDFDEWVGEVIEVETKEILYEKSYVELLLGLNDFQELIRRNIRDRFNSAGYKVLQHMITSELEHLDLQQGFKIESSKDNYKTKNNESEVGLEISIRGEIPDLEKIKRLLNHKNGSKEEIMNTIRERAEDSAAQILENCHAEHFYFFFERPYGKLKNENDKLEKENEEILKMRLVKTIEKALLTDEEEKTFGIRNLRLSINQKETKLIERFNWLQKKNHELKFELTPPGMIDYTEVLNVKIGFGIRTVSAAHWYIFKQKYKLHKEEQLKEITHLLKEKTIEILEDVHPDDLRAMNAKQSKLLKEKLQERLSEFLKPRIGLVIVFDFFRYVNLSETEEYSKALNEIRKDDIHHSKEERKKDNVHRQEIMNSLRANIQKLATEANDDHDLEELALLQEKLAAMRKEDLIQRGTPARRKALSAKKEQGTAPEDLLAMLGGEDESKGLKEG